MKLESYVQGKWVTGSGEGRPVVDAVRGEPVCHVDSSGINMREVVEYGRRVGGVALRAMTFHERAIALKETAKLLMAKKEDFYTLSFKTGTTRADAWPDIEGGIGTVFSYASLVTREFPNDTVLLEGEMEGLSRNGTFVGASHSHVKTWRCCPHQCLQLSGVGHARKSGAELGCWGAGHH